uniref:Uncharacterized protein n=1 Tax=Sebdenia flabellata TaxID=42024 RepID=A0A1C9C9U2_9FLOR|nr:hypothetical protein Sebd_065 [Sebdenia flabellata]AOM65152.1 hypothetical protein Sebd_065 [Sebdenia flabellata]
MESLENIFNSYDEFDMNELDAETPVGWSSICLDQTISYYIDCNSLSQKEKRYSESEGT